MLQKGILAVFFFFFTANVFAHTTQATDLSKGIIEGQHYITLSAGAQQQPVVKAFLEQDKGKIQVAEFFSYKCPGCYGVESIFSAWSAKQPSDVAIRRVPVAFNPAWEPLAKTYFVLEQLKEVDRLNPVIFDAIHKKGNRLESPGEIAVLLSQHGITAAEFNAAYEGFNVSRLWTQAQLLRQAEQVTSIPAVVVNGKYLTHLGLVKDPVQLTQVIDFLIAKSRQ